MWILFLLQVLGIFIKCIEAQSPILDSRCYLSTGGSAESFLVSEDIAVGAVIGKLNINGEPNIENGDISLSLRERDAPVEIALGTKELVLIAPLDKEAQRGPASVYVNVICDRRGNNDPSFVIPVNIRVTDVNDNVPQWIGSPYILTLSEVTVPGTRILQGARAVDQDQQGPFSTVEYHVLQGPYSDYVDFVSPLEGTLILKKPLDYEALKNFTVKLRAQDQGTPPKFSDTTLKVVITDADDQNPKFFHESYTGELPVEGLLGDVKINPEPIKALDQDIGINAPLEYSIKPSAEAKYFAINPSSGTIKLLTPLGPTDLQHSVTLVIKATQLDNSDRYALTTLLVTKIGKKQPKIPITFLQTKYTAKAREDLGIGSRILAITTNRPGKMLKYSILDAEQAQYFTVGDLGELVLQRSLDYERKTNHKFTVFVTDGKSNATADVHVDVIDINDWEPRFRQPHYEFVVPKENIKSDEPLALGKIEAADGDRNDKISLILKGPYASMFLVDTKGILWLKGDKPNVTTAHLLAIATDSGMPPKSASVPITVTLETLTAEQLTWAPGILVTCGIVIVLFVTLFISMASYIYKQRKSKSRIHSQTNSTTSGVNLMSNDHKLSGMHLVNNNLSIGNPMNPHGGSGSSISVGASTILAASLEREAQRERERERDRDNYTATVRNIISRASAAREGRIFDEEMERDSISNDESPSSKACWKASNQDIGNINGNGFIMRGKKLSWETSHIPVPRKTDSIASIDNMGSTENNLTVYF